MKLKKLKAPSRKSKKKRILSCVITLKWTKVKHLDVIWFKEGSDAAKTSFVEMIKNYKGRVIQVFGSQYPESIEMVEARFFTGDMNYNVKNRDNVDEPWLDANFKGFPLISSLAKLTLMQNDIRQTET